MKAFSIALSNVRRLFRDRSSIFFVFVFPLALVLLIGLQFGGSFAPQVGLWLSQPGPIATRFADQLATEPGIEIRTFDDEVSLLDAVETRFDRSGRDRARKDSIKPSRPVIRWRLASSLDPLASAPA